MFEKTMILDPGAWSVRLYDPGKRVIQSCRSVYFQKEKGKADAGSKAFETFWKLEKNQLKYPLSQGRVLMDIKPVLAEVLQGSGLQEGLLKPSVLVILDQQADGKQKEIWKQSLLECGFRRVRFIHTMDLMARDFQLVIHAGHSSTEIAVYNKGVQLAYSKIIYAAAQIDQQISDWIARRYRALIFQEDAAALRLSASRAFFEGRNPKLSCTVLDCTNQYVRITMDAMELWPMMQEVFHQIILWAKQVLSRCELPVLEQVLQRPILLSGGLSACFGLRQMLESQLHMKVQIVKGSQDALLKAAAGI